MDIKEFITGTPDEKNAQTIIKTFGQSKGLPAKRERQLSEAKGLTRRFFIRRTATGAVALALGGLTINQLTRSNEPARSDNPLYKNLARFKDKEVPPQITKEIYQDLSNSKYPSLSTSGKFLLENLNNPNNITNLDTIFKPNGKSISLNLEDLGTVVAVFADRGSLITTQIKIKDKNTGKDISFMGVKSDNSLLSISLNSGLFDVNASLEIIQLMIAKEGSHFFYFKELRERMINELRDKYEFSDQAQFIDLLVASAMEADNPKLRIPKLSDTFNNFGNNIDYAGFGHIVLDLAVMKDKGLINSKDQNILLYNFTGLKLGLSRRLIVKDQGIYKWADGLSPTAKPWLDVMKEVHNKSGRID